jgi:hypothetical protein
MMKDRTYLTVWQPPCGSAGYRGKPLTVCAGYTCNLPEVGEVAKAAAHWGKGNAAILPQNEQLLDAILVLNASRSQAEAWATSPDGGAA